MTYEDVQALPHIAIDENGNKRIDTIGNNVAWRVTMEDGYAINKPVYGDNEWKTVAMLYPIDELSTIVICAESELDEDAVINGNTTPEVEAMAEGENPVTEIE